MGPIASSRHRISLSVRVPDNLSSDPAKKKEKVGLLRHRRMERMISSPDQPTLEHSSMRRPGLWLVLGASAMLLLAGMDDPSKKSNPPAKSAKSVRSAKKAAQRDRDAPPPCLGSSRVAARPPARNMPELFDRMMDGFARDPARGFNGFLEELANLEGPALEGVTLTIAEERQAGLKARTEYLDKVAARGFR